VAITIPTLARLLAARRAKMGRPIALNASSMRFFPVEISFYYYCYTGVLVESRRLLED